MSKAELIGELGRLGLLERLNEATRERGLLDSKLLIGLVRDKEYERIQGIGDDFCPDIGLYNAVGAIYPLLDRNKRAEALGAHLIQFDQVNDLKVNSNHTPYIREPLLLADITIARPRYWPGLHDEERLWKGKASFADLEREIMVENGLFDPTKIKSDFLVAYAIMRKDFTSFGDDYIKAVNPNFLDRVLKGIAALSFANAEDEQKIEERRNKLFEVLPSVVHDRIEQFRTEKDWTLL